MSWLISIGIFALIIGLMIGFILLLFHFGLEEYFLTLSVIILLLFLAILFVNLIHLVIFD